MYLTTCVRPYTDELFISYINRLAIYNCAAGIHDFIRRYLYPAGKGSGNLLYPTDVFAFTARLRKKTEVFPDAEEVLGMTPYNAAAANLPYKEQARLLESILYNNARPSLPSLNIKHGFSLSYCPLCAKEDRENGIEPYLRLSHHLPGVTVCFKHGVPLVRIGKDLTDHRKRVFCDIDPSDPADTPYEVPDPEAALSHAGEMIRMEVFSDPVYSTAACPQCGKPFIAHPYSVSSGILCGECMAHLSDDEIIRLRLKALYDHEYVPENTTGDLSRENVIHVPCGNTLKRPLNPLIYGERKPCGKCSYNTAERIQSLVPGRFRVVPFERRGRIWQTAVTDTDCGYTFMASLNSFVKDPHCPRCEPRQKKIDMGTFTEYEVLEYTNNRTKMLLRHKKCGTVYSANKTSFLKGATCPICTPRYSCESVLEALEACTEGAVKAQPSDKRGYLAITLPDSQEILHLTFRNIMADLSAPDPKIIKCRRFRYQVPETKAHMVFMSVKNAEKEKGFWSFKDGITNEHGEQVEIDRCLRTYIQKMAKRGYLTRIDKGKYRIGNEYDRTTC